MTLAAERSALMAELVVLQRRLPVDILSPASSLNVRELREHVARYRTAAKQAA